MNNGESQRLPSSLLHIVSLFLSSTNLAIYGFGPGPTRMNVPPSGSPRPVAAANALILNLRRDVDELTRVWRENSGGSWYTRNTYLWCSKIRDIYSSFT
jgi:hypothetical protein